MAKPKLDSVDEIYDYGLDRKSRTLYIDSYDDDGEVNRDMLMLAMKGLSVLAQSPEPINIILNTPGGDVGNGLALYDYIRSLKQEIIITVYGEAYSMGSILLQAGDVRCISPRSSIMVHDGQSSVNSYNRKTGEAWHNFYKIQDRYADDILLNAFRSKDPTFSKQKLYSWLSSDKVFTAQEALEVGLVDEIVGVTNGKK